MLRKIADTLQCPTLQNTVLDAMVPPTAVLSVKLLADVGRNRVHSCVCMCMCVCVFVCERVSV